MHLFRHSAALYPNNKKPIPPLELALNAEHNALVPEARPCFGKAAGHNPAEFQPEERFQKTAAHLKQLN
jgi:hypothetical protein